jgi:hypothetical protein
VQVSELFCWWSAWISQLKASRPNAVLWQLLPSVVQLLQAAVAGYQSVCWQLALAERCIVKCCVHRMVFLPGSPSVADFQLHAASLL